MSIQVNVAANGRLSLPAVIRKRLGLTGGGAVLIDETPDGIVLRTIDQAIAQAQAIARKYRDRPEASVDAFLANRKVNSGE